MNWLVVWFVTVTWSTGPTVEADPYTGMFPTMVNANAVLHSSTSMKKRAFKTKQEADDFINKAPDEVKSKMHLVDISKDNVSENWEQEENE